MDAMCVQDMDQQPKQYKNFTQVGRTQRTPSRGCACLQRAASDPLPDPDPARLGSRSARLPWQPGGPFRGIWTPVGQIS